MNFSLYFDVCPLRLTILHLYILRNEWILYFSLIHGSASSDCVVTYRHLYAFKFDNQVRLYNSRPACVILKRQNDSIVGFDVFSGD